MKIGDKVRFLNESGGGRVAGFQGKNIVLVEDEDGFQVPMLQSEVVVIGEENYETSHVVEVKQRTSANLPQKGEEKASASDKDDEEPADRPVTFRPKPEERKGGEQLSAYLAFVPMEVKELSRTRFEAYFVNDSNFYMRFSYLSAEGANWRLRYTAEVEPNTLLFIEEFGREDLPQIERVAIQMVAYKRDKPFMLKPALDLQLRIDGVKFYKLHSFVDSPFFEEPAIIYPLIVDDRPTRSIVLDVDRMRREILEK